MTRPDREPELSHVEVDGHTIAYRRAGRGAPLVLLHGFLCDSRCWRAQLAGLADRFDVIAWDAPGAGASSDPPDTFTTADFARCLAGFLDAINVREANVVGLSWGGILAQAFYRLYPDRIRSLVLSDTYAGWRGSLGEEVSAERLAMCLRASTGPRDELVAAFIPGMFTADVREEVRGELSRIISEFHPIGFRLMAKSSAERDTRGLLSTIDVPTLVLWGGDDRRSPIDVGRQLYALIPDAELAVIPDAGHLSNMQDPDAFNAHIRRFCGGRRMCPVCEGVCPRCGIPMGPPAGSQGYVLCSPCHEVYAHAGCEYAASGNDEVT